MISLICSKQLEQIALIAQTVPSNLDTNVSHQTDSDKASTEQHIMWCLTSLRVSWANYSQHKTLQLFRWRFRMPHIARQSWRACITQQILTFEDVADRKFSIITQKTRY